MTACFYLLLMGALYSCHNTVILQIRSGYIIHCLLVSCNCLLFRMSIQCICLLTIEEKHYIIVIIIVLFCQLNLRIQIYARFEHNIFKNVWPNSIEMISFIKNLIQKIDKNKHKLICSYFIICINLFDKIIPNLKLNTMQSLLVAVNTYSIGTYQYNILSSQA